MLDLKLQVIYCNLLTECDSIIHIFDFCTVKCHSAYHPVMIQNLQPLTLTPFYWPLSSNTVNPVSWMWLEAPDLGSCIMNESVRRPQSSVRPSFFQLLCKTPGTVTLIESVRTLFSPLCIYLSSLLPLCTLSPRSLSCSISSQLFAKSADYRFPLCLMARLLRRCSNSPWLTCCISLVHSVHKQERKNGSLWLKVFFLGG